MQYWSRYKIQVPILPFSATEIPSLFTLIPDANTANIVQCSGDGLRNCRKISTNQNVLDNLKTGDRVNLLPQMDLYLVLRDAILPKSLSFTIEKNGQYHGKYISDGEGLITFGNNGYLITFISN